MEIKRLPDAPGWWLRNMGKTLKWFHVFEIEDDSLQIICKDTERFYPVEDYTSPLTRWYGPIEVPWTEYD